MNKYNDTSNLKKIKKIRKDEKFVKAGYSILYNDKLTSNGKLLLIAIMGDSDDFNVSQSLYCKRFGWDPKQFKRAIKDLIDNGFINRTQIKGTKDYFYIVSEYGNLNTTKEESKNEDVKSKKQEEPKVEEPKEPTTEDLITVVKKQLIDSSINYKDDYQKALSPMTKKFFKESVEKYVNEENVFRYCEDINKTFYMFVMDAKNKESNKRRTLNYCVHEDGLD